MNVQNGNADMHMLLIETERQLRATLAKNHDVEIQLKTLKTQYETKDHEISELQKTIESLEDETKLKKKIEKLEKENARLWVKIRKLEAEIITIKEQKKENQKRFEAVENNNEKLEEENLKLNKNLQKVGEEVKELKVELKDLAQETKENKEENRELKTAIAAFPIQLTASKQTLAFIHLGQLCCQIQALMYEKILPDHYNSWDNNYKIENIENDMEGLTETKSERKEARAKWQKLKRDLDWNEELENAIKVLQKSRNNEAHPRELDETSLREYASTLDHQRKLRGWLSLERLNRLIDIWKSLKQVES